MLVTTMLKPMENIRNSDIALFSSTQQGLSLNKMTPKQQGVAIKGVIFKLGVITGCSIPNDPLHLKTLEEEISKFIIENVGYSKLTFEEISTAARFNASGIFEPKVKHWQNIFNLDYLGDILNAWIKLKFDVEKKIDTLLMMKNWYEPLTLPELSEKEAIQSSRHAWETTHDFMFIDSQVYTILKNQGKMEISNDEKDRITKQAKEKICAILHKYFYAYYLEEKKDKHFNKIISMKIAVAEYFESEKMALLN